MIIASVAVFTDRYVNTTELKTGDLVVEITPGEDNGDDTLSPGGSNEMEIEIGGDENAENGLDADVRITVYATTDIKAEDRDSLLIKVDEQRITDYDEFVIAYEGVVTKDTSMKVKQSIELLADAGNQYANKTITLTTIIEAKQAGVGNWVELRTETINVSGKDIKVVPKR